MGFLNRNWVDFDFLGGGTTEADDLAPRHLTGSYPGKIRAIAGGEVVASYEPGSTSTPIQDAVDAINANGKVGIIEAPEGTIASAGNVTGFGGIQLLGQGFSGGVGTGTRITTPAGTPFMTITSDSDGRGCFIDQVEFRSASTPRTAPMFDFQYSPNSFDLGRVKFGVCDGHDIFAFSTGGPYSSHWQHVEAALYNRFIDWGDADIPGLSIGNLYLGSNDSTTPEIEKTVTNSTGNLNVESWNKGGTACPVFSGAGGTVNSGVRFGPGNFEPSTAATIDQVFYFNGSLRTELAEFQIHGSYTLNKTPVVCGNNQGYMDIMVNEPLTVEVDNAGPLIYKGDSANVTDATGTILTHGVSCLGDLTSVT